MKKVLAIALTILVAALIFAGCSSKPADNGDASADGKIDAKMILVLEDKTEIPYDLHVTDGATIREALKEAGLIGEADETSFMIETIDGHEAKMVDGVLWLISDEEGNQIKGTCDDITVSAGMTIKMIYTVAPNFDD